MLPKFLSFVDVETTGLSPIHNKIIEIGIIRVEENKIVEKLNTLINPGIHIDPFILSLTGINPGELKNAPSFYAVKNQIKKLLKDSLFIAHNATFDYSFLKSEFERLEESFSSKICCSVKLSKKLYPKFTHHNLDAIIQRFNLTCKNRHRAFDDAKAIWDFYKLSLEKLGTEKVAAAFEIAMKRASLPASVSAEIVDSLPNSPGVYIFYNKDNTPLYIGKSKSIRTRVLSHFANSKKINVDMKIAQSVSRVEAIETAGELGALLLEATLIKKLLPLYNRQLRYAYKLLALKKVQTTQKYYSIEVTHLEDIPIDQINQVLNIFKSKRDLKNFLLSIAKEYSLCLNLLGLEKGRKNCFNYHLGFCFGACSNKENFLKYNLRFDTAFAKTRIANWPFKGPIGIKEKGSKEEFFVVDKWCVLGTLKNASDSLEDISQDYLFDTDTYKILNNFLKAKKGFKGRGTITAL